MAQRRRRTFSSRQHRWTALLCVILAVPHMVVLHILTFVAAVIAFVGWWGALFTGRLPESAVTFLSGHLRWMTGFNGYLGLLTDGLAAVFLRRRPGSR